MLCIENDYFADGAIRRWREPPRLRDRRRNPKKALAPPGALRHVRASNEMRRIRSSRIDRTRPGRPAPPRRRRSGFLRPPPSSCAPGSTTRRLRVALARLRASRNYESLIAPDVGREFGAAMAEHDKVRVRKRPLETIPILFVAQGGRNEPVCAGDPLVVRDNGALAIAIAVSIACLPVSGATGSPSNSHSNQRHLHLHRQAPTALPASGTQTPSLGTPTFQKPAARPLVTNDSDGLSRDPEDCNRGCLDSAE